MIVITIVAATAVIVIAVDLNKGGVIGVVTDIIVAVREHPVAPVHDHIALVFWRHDDVVYHRERQKSGIHSSAPAAPAANI